MLHSLVDSASTGHTPKLTVCRSKCRRTIMHSSSRTCSKSISAPCSVFRNMPICSVEPYYSEQFCNGAVRRVRHPSAQTTLVGGIEKRVIVLRPQREPVGGRFPLFRPQPSDAFLQATDGKDIYAIYHGLPKGDLRVIRPDKHWNLRRQCQSVRISTVDR